MESSGELSISLPPTEAAPPPERMIDAVHVGRVKYVFLFSFMFLLLSLFDVVIEKETDYGLARVERLWKGNNIFMKPPRWEGNPKELAAKLEVTPEELQRAQHIVEAYINSLDAGTKDFWSRLYAVHFGDYKLSFGANLALNFLFAFFIALAYFVRERVLVAQDVIDYQQRRYQRLDAELDTRMKEIARILDKFNTLQDKLVEAEKLASIGRLSATLAHEIRNPLSIIKSSTEIVMDDIEEKKSSSAAVGLIRDEINRLDRIITDLLNFARPKTPRRTSLALQSLVRHWLPPVVEELEKHRIQLVPQFEKADGDVFIDADQLYQVFLNVIWNARDALIGTPNPHLFVRIEEGGDQFLKLIVQDTGVGMTPDVLRQIKEPFYTTKAQGTGLGIPVSVQLIEGMGGRFEFESKIEYGTTVTLWLPRTGSETAADSFDSLGRQHLREVLAQTGSATIDSMRNDD